MISAIFTALSGLSALQKQLDVTANNVANVNTAGFKKSRATLATASPQGVQARVEQVNIPGPVVLEQTPEGVSLVEQSNVDISEEMVNLLIGKSTYEANLKTLKTADETLGSLLDVIDEGK